MSEPDEFACEVCGAVRKRRLREGAKQFAARRFCSVACARAVPDLGPARFCERCGKQLELKMYGARKESVPDFRKRKFCSPECAQPGRRQHVAKVPSLCILGDGKPAKTRGMCVMHYTRWRRYGDPIKTLLFIGSGEERFTHFADVSAGPDGCHPYTGSLDPQGYGRLDVEGRKTTYAHIFAWVREHGPVPEGWEVDHTCHDPMVCKLGAKCPHRRCCNPRHLEAVPKSQNRSRTSNRKLDDATVWVLYQRRMRGEKMIALATEAGITRNKLRERFKRVAAYVTAPEADRG